MHHQVVFLLPEVPHVQGVHGQAQAGEGHAGQQDGGRPACQVQPHWLSLARNLFDAQKTPKDMRVQEEEVGYLLGSEFSCRH